MKQRILNLLVAADQMAYSLITLGTGMPNETISSAAYNAQLTGKPWGKYFRKAIDTLFWFDKDHCRTAWLRVAKGHQLPESYKTELAKAESSREA